MGWVGLHTSPQINPHATICYWKVDDPLEEAGINQNVHTLIVDVVRDRRALGWRGTYPFIVNGLDLFGAKHAPVEVALIEPAFGYKEQVENLLSKLSRYHRSEWPVNPHVTAHHHRPFFEFKWIGLHLDGHTEYWRLTP